MGLIKELPGSALGVVTARAQLCQSRHVVITGHKYEHEESVQIADTMKQSSNDLVEPRWDLFWGV